eukprot:jgi/Tetstr1/459102/TSEL_004552.t1
MASHQLTKAWEPPAVRRRTDVPSDVSGLRLLAVQGCWREIVERLRSKALSKLPVEEGLSLSAFYVLALVKLRQYVPAAEVLDAFGDLDAPRFSQAGPDGMAAGRGSLVPFGLRWLAAELPFRLGRLAASQDAFYRLSEHCKLQALMCEARPAEVATHAGGEEGMEEEAALGGQDALLPGGAAVPAATWWRRYEAAGLALMNQHLRAKQHVPALQWLRILERRRRGEPRVLSMVGYVQMMAGDLVAAEEMFARVASQGTPLAETLTGRNRSLLLFARRKFREAQEDLQAQVQNNPGDSIAANNRSISQMYCCELTGGISELEGQLRARPLDNLSEPLLLTLSLMYELSLAGAAAEAKRRVSQWASACAPDDFDLTCTRSA